MKKKFSFTIIAVFLFNLLNAQIHNDSFENWTNFGTYSNPNSWNTSNQAGSDPPTCEQGTPGAVGASYLKLTTKMGEISPLVAEVSSQFAYSQRPLNLTCQHQYFPGKGDSAQITVYLKEGNVTIAFGDTVISIPTSGWTNLSIPIKYNDSTNPDSADIHITTWGASSLIVGSILYVDNLAFSGTSTWIKEIKEELSSFTVYPNPFVSEATVDFKEEQKNTTIKIMDMVGKEIRTVNFTGKQLKIGREKLQAGTYFIQAIDKNKNVVNKKIGIGTFR